MKRGFLDKLIDRLDRLDPGSLQNQFLRLARDKGFLETVFHAIQEGIIVIDGSGHIVYVNRATEKILGLPMESAMGTHIGRHLKDVEWRLVLEYDEDEWSRLISREIEITYPEHRFLDMYVAPLTASIPDEKGAVVILRDITSDRQDEVSMIESERLNAVTLLAAGVAHEIGNPLNSLHIHLQLLEREIEHLPPQEKDNLAELVTISKNEVSRLDQIISQFLRAIRPSPPKMEQASVKDILEDTLDFLHPEIRDRDILVETECAGDIPSALLDKNQIKQVFFNIIRNAIQAMPGGGLLKINVSSNDRFILIAFKDSGAGIQPEDLGKIFEPYHTTKKDGSGLGLLVVQRIIRDHGGQIEVHSEPEKGTVFAIMLPRDQQRIRLLKAHRGAHLGEHG